MVTKYKRFVSEVFKINKYDRELLELATNIMFDYDGLDGSVESMKGLIDEIDTMVKAVLCNNSKEYLEKLKG